MRSRRTRRARASSPKDRTVNHRGSSHAGRQITPAVAVVAHSVENDPDDEHRKQQHQEQNGSRSDIIAAVLRIFAQLRMYAAEKGGDGSVVVLVLHAAIEIAVDKAGRKAAEKVVKPAACNQTIGLRPGVDDKDGIVLAEPELLRPGIGNVLKIVHIFIRHDCDDRTDHVVPVGVVKVDGFLRAVRENARLVDHVRRKRLGGKRLVQRSAALRYGNRRLLADAPNA